MTPIPAALREALEARFNTELGGNKVALWLKDMNDEGADTMADRARAMATALRWGAPCRCEYVDPPPCSACEVIAALEQEARSEKEG